MIERLRSWLPLLPLLLLMAATFWLNSQVQSSVTGPNKNLRHDPDYIIDNFTATTLDEQGKIRYVMSAKKMWHYPDDDTTLLELPQIISLSADHPPMHMTALKGEFSAKGDEVFLRDNVVIVRPQYANKSELTFNTNYLHVVPNKNIADTHQEITLVDANTRINSVGMEMDYKSRKTKFKSHVKTVYEPVKR
jgi:lipopolysaccharide export system protein LptC